MLHFVMVGLMCNSLGCYWADIDNKQVFENQERCALTATAIKGRSIMYFDTGCRVYFQTKEQ